MTTQCLPPALLMAHISLQLLPPPSHLSHSRQILLNVSYNSLRSILPRPNTPNHSSLAQIHLENPLFSDLLPYTCPNDERNHNEEHHDQPKHKLKLPCLLALQVLWRPLFRDLCWRYDGAHACDVFPNRLFGEDGGVRDWQSICCGCRSALQVGGIGDDCGYVGCERLKIFMVAENLGEGWCRVKNVVGIAS